MSLIDTVHTSCKQCVFAKYDHNTQIDCHLNFIEKHRENEGSVLEAYDEEKEFFIINKKKCLGYRENSWFDKRQLSHLNIEEKIQNFKQNNYLRYLIVVDLKYIHQEKFEHLAQELKNLSIQPQKIIFVRYQQDDNKVDFQIIQKILSDANLSCEWRIQTILEDKDYKNVLHSIINLNKKYRFILAITDIDNNLNSIVELGNDIVHNKMERFVVIRNSGGSYVLFSSPNYRYSLLVNKQDILDDNSQHIVI